MNGLRCISRLQREGRFDEASPVVVEAETWRGLISSAALTTTRKNLPGVHEPDLTQYRSVAAASPLSGILHASRDSIDL
jgi:hypothetical protein